MISMFGCDNCSVTRLISHFEFKQDLTISNKKCFLFLRVYYQIMQINKPTDCLSGAVSNCGISYWCVIWVRVHWLGQGRLELTGRGILHCFWSAGLSRGLAQLVLSIFIWWETGNGGWGAGGCPASLMSWECLCYLAPFPRPSYPAPRPQSPTPGPHKILTSLNWT